MANSILEEVRMIRQQHTASMGCDLDRIYADLKTHETRRVAEGWILVAPPTSPPPESERNLQRTRFSAP